VSYSPLSEASCKPGIVLFYLPKPVISNKFAMLLQAGGKITLLCSKKWLDDTKKAGV
jgi:hypothetical protein